MCSYVQNNNKKSWTTWRSLMFETWISGSLMPSTNRGWLEKSPGVSSASVQDKLFVLFFPVTCPMIISLMLAQAVRLTAQALKGNCLLAPRISSNWKFDRMYVPRQFYTQRSKTESWILLIQQRRRLSKRLSPFCEKSKRFWIFAAWSFKLRSSACREELHTFRYECTHSLTHSLTTWIHTLFMYSHGKPCIN